MSQFYSLKVNQIKKETHDSVSVSFEIESKLVNDFNELVKMSLDLNRLRMI